MKIAIVDDTLEDRQLLTDYLKRYQQENNLQLIVHTFSSGLDLLGENREGYDILFLDIEMPGCDGLEVTQEIRQRDSAVSIIFVTSMAQYAIDGYQVNAFDFIVKPIGYYNVLCEFCHDSALISAAICKFSLLTLMIIPSFLLPLCCDSSLS